MQTHIQETLLSEPKCIFWQLVYWIIHMGQLSLPMYIGEPIGEHWLPMTQFLVHLGPLIINNNYYRLGTPLKT